MPAARRAWTPIISLAVAYVGIVVASVLSNTLRSYDHTDELTEAVIFLAWTLLALVAVAVSWTSLALVSDQLQVWLGVAVIVLNVPILVLAAGALGLAIWNFENYTSGISAYDAARQVCGLSPIIAEGEGFGGGQAYFTPSHPEYNGMRYDTQQRQLFGYGERFFCTASEAEAQGYRPDVP